LDNIDNINGNGSEIVNNPGQVPTIIQDPNPSDGVAVVTRRKKGSESNVSSVNTKDVKKVTIQSSSRSKKK